MSKLATLFEFEIYLKLFLRTALNGIGQYCWRAAEGVGEEELRLWMYKMVPIESMAFEGQM